MNSLIIIQEEHYSWLRNSQSVEHPAMASLCNKPLLEYLIDFVILFGCKKIRLVLEEPDSSVDNYFGNGERLGVDISYGHCRAGDSLKSIIVKNGSFCEKSQLMIFQGLLFFHYDKNCRYEIIAQGSGSGFLFKSETGSVFYRAADHTGEETDITLKPMISISSPQQQMDLFNLAMQVVREEQNRFVLPGYGTEKGVVIGRNVEIGRKATVHGPVVMGSNVRLLGEVVVGPNAVIGNNVIIDDGSEVRDSVVLENTYIGRSLLINDKMVSGNRVVAVNNGKSIEISDEFLLSPIKRTPVLGVLRYGLNVSGAVLLGLFQFVPFCIMYAVRLVWHDVHMEKKRFLVNSDGGTRLFLLPALHSSTFTASMIRSLSLDKFLLLKDVFTGKLQLIGNLLIPDSREGRKFVSDFTGYMPGIFSYTEAERLLPGTIESEIAERYYSANRGFLKETKTLAKAFLNNLLR